MKEKQHQLESEILGITSDYPNTVTNRHFRQVEFVILIILYVTIIKHVFFCFSRLVYAANKMYMSFQSHPTLVALQVNQKMSFCGLIYFIILFIFTEIDEG